MYIHNIQKHLCFQTCVKMAAEAIDLLVKQFSFMYGELVCRYFGLVHMYALFAAIQVLILWTMITECTSFSM